MDEKVRTILENAGIDVEDARNRFMNNDGMYIKFLKKFLEDSNYNKMLAALERADIEEAFVAAHTLKGVTANLSIFSIYEPLKGIVEALRANTEPKRTEMEKIENAQQAVREALEMLE